MKVKTFVKTALNTINTFVVNDIQGNFIRLDCQQAGNAGDAVRRGTQTDQGSEEGADSAADDAGNERFHKPEVHTENRRLGDAQGSRKGRGLVQCLKV